MEMGDDIWKNIQEGYNGNNKKDDSEIIGNKEGYFPDTGENMLPVDIMIKIKKIAIMDIVMAGSLTKFPKAYWEVDIEST